MLHLKYLPLNIICAFFPMRDEIILESHPDLSEEHINLCYLGSINNIIDMDLIVEMCKAIGQYKPVTLHIIGAGEKSVHP